MDNNNISPLIVIRVQAIENCTASYNSFKISHVTPVQFQVLLYPWVLYILDQRLQNIRQIN